MLLVIKADIGRRGRLAYTRTHLSRRPDASRQSEPQGECLLPGRHEGHQRAKAHGAADKGDDYADHKDPKLRVGGVKQNKATEQAG